MCVDNTNLSFEHSNLNTLLNTVSEELIKIKVSLFHKSGRKLSIPPIMSYFVISSTIFNNRLSHFVLPDAL